MAQRSKDSVASHVQSEVQILADSQGLPFQHLLSEQKILAVLQRTKVEFRDRIYTPMITLWAFLSQVTASKDASCEYAVSRVLAERVARRLPACSTDTNSYCRARHRLPEQVFSDLTRELGQELHREAPLEWLWKGRRVAIVDGSTVTTADTPENQQAYPQSSTQKAGLGFPLVRFVVLLSLSVGTVLQCAIGPCRGKNTGELRLFRQAWDAFEAGDVVLGDRFYDAYRDIALLRARGIDCVFGAKQSRKLDFRRGRQLGREDHVVVWRKPHYDATRYESREEWESLPAELETREVRVVVRRQGYRERPITIVTTLIDADVYSSQDLTDLFKQRWHCELDLRSIKQSLGMDHMRCKTPAMVCKELWAHLLAYNLIRIRMAQAGALHGHLPRTLSFTAAKTHIHNFAVCSLHLSRGEWQRMEFELLRAIAACRVGGRPDRKEPREIKKRKQKYKYMTKPRDQTRQGLTA
jgi:hypothetical protein